MTLDEALARLDESRRSVERLVAESDARDAEVRRLTAERDVARSEAAAMSRACAEEMYRREVAEKAQAVLAQERDDARAALRSVAERQRTACAAFLRDNYYEVAQSEAVSTDPMWCCCQTPLVTDEETP